MRIDTEIEDMTAKIKHQLIKHPNMTDEDIIQYIRWNSNWLCLTDAEEILKKVKNEK